MQALLDTNAFLWWVTNEKKLSSAAHTIISNPQNQIFFSIVSGWEIVIKTQIGKLPLPESPEIYIPSRLSYYDFKTLSINMKDVLQTGQLELHHKDPTTRSAIALVTVNLQQNCF
jgi:PIN domain nuclease of toxin-antitoxin system